MQSNNYINEHPAFAFAFLSHACADGRQDSCVSSKSGSESISTTRRRNAAKSRRANSSSTPSSSCHRYSDIADPPSPGTAHQIYEDVDLRGGVSAQDASLRRQQNSGARVATDAPDAVGATTLPSGGVVYLQLPELQCQQPDGTMKLHPVIVHLPDTGGVMLLGGNSTHETGQKPCDDGDGPPSCYQTMDLKALQSNRALTPGCYAALTSMSTNAVGCDVIGFRRDDLGQVVVSPTAVYCRSDVYDGFSSTGRSREQTKREDLPKQSHL